MAPAAVIFDFYGTLVPSTTSAMWAEHAALSAEPLGIPAARWRAALDDSFAERVTGALGDLRRTFATLARRCGAEPDDAALAAACAVRLRCQRSLFRPRPDALATLDALRGRGLRIGLLSDCTVELAESWPDLPFAPLVEATVFSCLAGRRKPDPELYRAAADALGVAERDCVYVGDGGGGELTGAAGRGMTAVLLRAADWTPDGMPGREPGWRGPEVDRLGALPGYLDNLLAAT